MRDTTIVIKTFDRPECLDKLLSSLDKYCKNIPVIVVDDGRVSAKDSSMIRWPQQVRYERLPFDVGLAAGRNHGVKCVRTRFTVIFDDDFVVPESHPLTEDVLGLFERSGLDLLGFGLSAKPGNVSWWAQRFVMNEREVHLIPVAPICDEDFLQRVDLCLNCFIAKTEALKKVPWDDELKMGEHWLHFLAMKNFGLRIGIYRNPKRFFLHEQVQGDNFYREMRNRNDAFHALGIKKYGISRVVQHPIPEEDMGRI